VEIIDIEKVKTEYNIENPLQIIDILALWGDTVDNVPGVPGIGEKTAANLISTYKSINNIYLNINELKGKQKENLLKHRDGLELSQKLVTIDTNVPLDTVLDDIKIQTPNVTKLVEIYSDLEFNSLKNRLLANNTNLSQPSKQPQTGNKDSSVTTQTALFDLFGNIVENIESNLPSDILSINDILCNDYSFNQQSVNYQLIDNQEDINRLIDRLIQYDEIALDTETTGLNTLNSDIIGLAIAIKENEAYYINMPYNFDETKAILQQFQPIFDDTKKLIVGQNLKYDLSILANYGLHFKTKLFDTMLAHYLLEPELHHNLDFLASKYLNYKMIPITALIGAKGKNQKNMRDVSPNIVAYYSCEDVDITLKIKHILAPKVEEQQLDNLFWNIEMPLIQVLISMERNGVEIDVQNINAYSETLKKELVEIEKKIYLLAGQQFNIASPKQLGVVLFENMKIISNAKKTKSGQYSTGEDELLKLKDKHQIINEILEYRGINKLLNTYVDVLPTLVDPKTQRLHTTYNQAVTSTGRLSSSDPNLQNIPIREERGRELRKSFVASEGCVLLAADYSQVELRIMAHLSADKNMLAAFNSGQDIHAATAAKIYKIPISDVTSDMRRNAKTANFGIIYGISAFGLAERLQISRTDAKQLIDNYFEIFPDVKNYMNKSIQLVREHGFVKTLFGRKLHLTDINSNNSFVRSFAERIAINAPIQGSSADIIKIAMNNIFTQLNDKNLRTKMLLQVHDELVFEVPTDELETVKPLIINEMQNACQLSIPLLAEVGIGENWLSAH
jgi:DNA polymerase-1